MIPSLGSTPPPWLTPPSRWRIWDDRGMTTGRYLERWLSNTVKGAVKETTHANYAYVVRKHVSPALGHAKLKSLTLVRVRSFYAEKARCGLSAATVKKMHVVLRKALAQAVSDGLVPRNAADGVKRRR